MIRSSIETLIKAMKILSEDIQSGDGVANAAILEAAERLEELQKDNLKLQKWIDDLQSGMYINCVYCGHQYGSKEDTPTSMAETLKQHVEECPDHPMSKLKKENSDLKKELSNFSEMWTKKGGEYYA